MGHKKPPIAMDGEKSEKNQMVEILSHNCGKESPVSFLDFSWFY